RDRLLPRFLRNRIHHHSALGACRRQARHRSCLVRRVDLRQYSNELHASAIRLRLVLSTRHRTTVDQNLGDLLGRHSLGVLASHSGYLFIFLAGPRDLLTRPHPPDPPPKNKNQNPPPRSPPASRFWSAAPAAISRSSKLSPTVGTERAYRGEITHVRFGRQSGHWLARG